MPVKSILFTIDIQAEPKNVFLQKK